MAVEEGRYIHRRVLESLSAQNCPIKLWVTTQDDGFHAAGARNRVKQHASSPYVLMMDNDIILEPHSIERMVAFLEANNNFAAIGISKHSVPEGSNEVFIQPHIDCAPVLWRLEDLKKVAFEYRNQCECMAVCEDIRNMGKEIGFLTGIRANHIPDTRAVQ